MAAITIPVSKKEYNRRVRILRRPEQITCLNEGAYVNLLVTARDMLLRGKEVRAKIVKGY